MKQAELAGRSELKKIIYKIIENKECGLRHAVKDL
jgi:hypothetical protein